MQSIFQRRFLLYNYFVGNLLDEGWFCICMVIYYKFNNSGGFLFMRGTVKKDGTSWFILFDIGKDPLTGKRKQKKKRGFKTKKKQKNTLVSN